MPAPDAARMRLINDATAHLSPPLAALDMAALQHNADDLRRRAAGVPIRVASKSIRNRDVLRWVLGQPGYRGVLAYTLPEALWLAGGDDAVTDDVLVAYPTVDTDALATLSADEDLAARVTVMVDSQEGIDLVCEAVASPSGHPVRVCLDVDASWRLLGDRLHIGVRRSPLHSPDDVRALAIAVLSRPQLRLVGVMAYEAQIAGLGDVGSGVLGRSRAMVVRGLQAGSARELRQRRAAIVAAVREVADLELVNGGGTGSLEGTSTEAAVTEVAAGSGLFGPWLFDGYRSFSPRPAVMFALPVVRRPAPRTVTVLGGGWIASGPPGPDREPQPYWPPGLDLLATEGAGEVQTPLHGDAAQTLRVGDRVWFRHAKSGEICEHVDSLAVVTDKGVTPWPTYRGERRTFV